MVPSPSSPTFLSCLFPLPLPVLAASPFASRLMLTAVAYVGKQVSQRSQDRLSQAASTQGIVVGTPWLNAVMVAVYPALPVGTRRCPGGTRYSSSTIGDTGSGPLPAEWASAIPRFAGSLQAGYGGWT